MLDNGIHSLVCFYLLSNGVKSDFNFHTYNINYELNKHCNLFYVIGIVQRIVYKLFRSC